MRLGSEELARKAGTLSLLLCEHKHKLTGNLLAEISLNENVRVYNRLQDF